MEITKKELRELLESLEERQRKFAEEYLVDFNGKQAAIRAGYAEKTARQQASRLLTHVNVQRYLQYLVSKRAERTKVTADRVVQEIAKIAFHNVGELLDYFDGEVLFKDIDEMDFPEIIKTIKVKEVAGAKGERLGKIAEIVVHDKLKALELLGKHTLAFTDNVNLMNNGGSFAAPQQVTNVYINHRKKGEELE